MKCKWTDTKSDHLSLVMRKPAFCICENEDADQLRSNCAADQRLCFRYTDSTIPLLPKSEISSLELSSVVVQPGLCLTKSETPKTRFSHNEAHLSLCLCLLMVPLHDVKNILLECLKKYGIQLTDKGHSNHSIVKVEIITITRPYNIL